MTDETFKLEHTILPEFAHYMPFIKFHYYIDYKDPRHLEIFHNISAISNQGIDGITYFIKVRSDNEFEDLNEEDKNKEIDAFWKLVYFIQRRKLKSYIKYGTDVLVLDGGDIGKKYVFDNISYAIKLIFNFKEDVLLLNTASEDGCDENCQECKKPGYNISCKKISC